MVRQVRWYDNVLNMNTAAGTQDTEGLVGGITLDQGRRGTVTRIVYDLSFASNTVAGAYGLQQLGIGMGIASQEAFAANALPEPESETEFPVTGWLYRNIIMVGQNGSGVYPVVRLSGEIRAQRKLDIGDLFLIITNQPVVFGTSFSVLTRGIIRVLVRLP